MTGRHPHAAWCASTGERGSTEKALAEAMELRGYVKVKRNGVQTYVGLMIAADPEDDAPERRTGEGWGGSVVSPRGNHFLGTNTEPSPTLPAGALSAGHSLAAGVGETTAAAPKSRPPGPDACPKCGNGPEDHSGSLLRRRCPPWRA